MVRVKKDESGPKVVVDVHVEQADRLKRNPDFNAIYNRTRNDIIADIERTVLDGTDLTEAVAIEHVRRLQTLLDVRRSMLMIVGRAETIENHNKKDAVSHRKQRRAGI